MPRGDGTGPMGLGPMTGRAAGYCAGFSAPGFINPMGGRLGLGRGRGFSPYTYGRGQGLSPYAYGRGRAFGLPYYSPSGYAGYGMPYGGFPGASAGYGAPYGGFASPYGYPPRAW